MTSKSYQTRHCKLRKMLWTVSPAVLVIISIGFTAPTEALNQGEKSFWYYYYSSSAFMLGSWFKSLFIVMIVHIKTWLHSTPLHPIKMYICSRSWLLHSLWHHLTCLKFWVLVLLLIFIGQQRDSRGRKKCTLVLLYKHLLPTWEEQRDSEVKKKCPTCIIMFWTWAPEGAFFLPSSSTSPRSDHALMYIYLYVSLLSLKSTPPCK